MSVPAPAGPRIEIDPAECRSVAAFLHARADEGIACAQRLSQASAAAPAMPSSLLASVTESICAINEMLGANCSELDLQAEVLETAAEIIELDQAIPGADWGLAALDAAFGAVMTEAGGARSAIDALDVLLARTDLTRLSVQDWQDIAYWKAGIDPDAWDPNRGLYALDDIVNKVYAYYGSLFLDDPDLQWAGMANIVGPMFYAGWQDIYAIRHVADEGQRLKYLHELLGIPALPSWAHEGLDVLADLGLPDPTSLVEDLTSEELQWFERQFLYMQKDIFDDLAWQHEMYRYGGVELMRELAEKGTIGADVLPPWENIASGDPERVTAGNKSLLFREQRTVIYDQYNEMRGHHGPVGYGFTYVTTMMAENPMPGGRSYRDFDGITIDSNPEIGVGPIDVPVFGPTVPDIEFRVPAGNISYFDDRWAWIEQDMFPRYQDLLADPEKMRELVSTPVSTRAEGFRKIDLLPYPR